MTRVPVKAVVQQDVTGCAVASVAVLAGVSYREARRAAAELGIYVEDPRLWSETEYVRKLLIRFGIRAGSHEVPFSSWEQLPDRALLSIKWHLEDGKPFWHWVVFVRNGDLAFVLDSKKNLKCNIRKDFGRMHPKWFIPILDYQSRS